MGDDMKNERNAEADIVNTIRWASCAMCGLPTLIEHGITLCSWCNFGPLCASCHNHCEPTDANSILVPQAIDNATSFFDSGDPGRPIVAVRFPRSLIQGKPKSDLRNQKRSADQMTLDE